jgi:secondary thiamine-phosphate synthase enzyme
MRQSHHELTVATNGQGFYDITADVVARVNVQRYRTGLLTLFIRHTSASLLIQENADREVLGDLTAFFARLAPERTSLYRHVAEGADDMPAHIRAALTQTQLSIPIVNGRLGLGTWQGIYVVEHRRAAHERRVLLHVLGD